MRGSAAGPSSDRSPAGLAIVDVRDLVAIILKALEGRGRDGESYLVVGANLSYRDVVRRSAGRAAARPIPSPSRRPCSTAAGRFLERAARRTGRRPLLTAAYGRLSGWTAFYDNAKSRRDFDHIYIDAERTIEDGWRYFRSYLTRTGSTIAGRVRLRPVDALGRRPVIRGLGQEDVLDEGLRIAVDQREPGALDLDHDLVALEEAVVGARAGRS